MDTPSGPHDSPLGRPASGPPFSLGRRVLELIQSFPLYNRESVPNLDRDDFLRVQQINIWIGNLRQIIDRHVSQDTSPYDELKTTMIEIIRWMNDPTRTGSYRGELRDIFIRFRATMIGWRQMIEDPDREEPPETGLPGAWHGPGAMDKNMRIKDKVNDPWPVINRLADIVHKIQFDRNR